MDKLISRLDSLDVPPEQVSGETVVAIDHEMLAFLMDEIENYVEVFDGHFQIDTEEKLDWFASKCMSWETEADKIEKEAKARVARIRRARENFIAHFKEQAIKFTLERLSYQKKKSFDLLCGVRMGMRKAQSKLEFDPGFEPVVGNEVFEKIRTFARENSSLLPELENAIKTTYSVLKTPLNLWYKGGKNASGEEIQGVGEIPPGMNLIPEHEEWYMQ